MKKWRLLSLRPAGWCVAHSNQEVGGQSVFLLLQHTVLGQPEVNLHKGGTLAGVELRNVHMVSAAAGSRPSLPAGMQPDRVKRPVGRPKR